MDDQNVAIRLKGFIEYEGLSHSQFADRCGIPRPSLSQLLTGRNKKISDVIVGQIHKAFPRLSVLWLMFGEGPMISPQEPASPETFNNGLFDISDASLFNEVQEITPHIKPQQNQSNVNALSIGANAIQNPQNKQYNEDIRISELQKQLENLTKNPRKVSHITVYYDDSTFETFKPER